MFTFFKKLTFGQEVSVLPININLMCYDFQRTLSLVPFSLAENPGIFDVKCVVPTSA